MRGSVRITKPIVFSFALGYPCPLPKPQGKTWGHFPRGPFRTKNTTTIAKIVNYYAVVFLLRPPDLLRRGPFSERENVCNSQENGVRTRCAAIVNHSAVVKILRVVNLLRVVFLVRRGPLGLPARYDWTTGVPDNGNEWRKFRFASRSHPLHPLVTMFRNGQSTVGRPKWTKMDLFRPKCTILVHFGLANTKIQFGIRSF